MHPTQRKQDEIEAEQFLKGIGQQKANWLFNKYADQVGDDLLQDEVALARYLMLRESGVEHVWAHMNACRKASGTKGTDRAFDEHARARMDAMPKWQQEAYLKKAKAAGIATQGKFHCSGLGPPDDPKAWVSDTHDILQVCRERNYSCEGHVSHQGTQVPPQQRDMAPDLVDEMVQYECKEDPALAQKVRKSTKALDSLRHLVREKYGPTRKRH